MDLAGKLFKGDRGIWIIFMFLCLISLVEVFSATSTIAYKNANHWAPIMRHGTFLLAGFACILVLDNCPVRWLRVFIAGLPVSIGLLVLTLFIGATTNDAQRWLEIGGIQFQPSEFAKLSLIVFVAFLLSKKGQFTDAVIFKWIVGATSVTCILIFTENLSTALLLGVVCFIMMFIGQVPIKNLLKLAGAVILAAVLFLMLLKFTPVHIVKDYMPERLATWQSRLNNFKDKEDSSDPAAYKIGDDNYQVTHAKIAIARGGILGQMPGHGQQRDFLPQAYSDFIYAIIIEEMGLFGGFFVLFLYMALLVRVGMIARRCDKLFPKYLVLGCGLLIVIQALTNMAVAVNLIPVTGQPLPLVSRGGTSTIITCVYFGIILSVSRFAANIGNEDDPDLEPSSNDGNGLAKASGLIPKETQEIIVEDKEIVSGAR